MGKTIKRLISVALLLLGSSGLMAHEGHDTPGVLPLPLNGGKLGEAVHKHDPSKKGDEKELFFEVVFKGKEVRVFPLVLTGKKNDSFKKLSPKKDLKDIKVSAEFPRSKRTETLKVSLSDDKILAPLDPKREYRFFLNVSAMHEGELKVAKIQVEKK